MSKIKKPIYEPPEIDESTMTEQEVAVAKRKETLHKIRERKIKKAFKTYRFRGLKNFLFWFFGVMSSVGIILGSIFVGVKVIPISTYLKWSGQDSSEIVSENISDKSVLDAFLSLEEYTFSDVPVIETMVKDLLAETGVDDFVVVDYSALKDVKFLNASNDSDLIDEVAKCVKLNPEVEMFQTVKAFSEHTETDRPLQYMGDTATVEKWTVKDGVKAELYCYATIPASGGSPANVVYVASHNVTYEDVIVNGKINEKLKKLDEDEMDEVVFYYKPIYELPLLDIVDNIDLVLDRIEITEVVALAENGGEINPIIANVLNGLTIGKLTDEDFEIESLLNNLKLNAIDGISELLGEFGELKVFSDWQKVDNSLQAVKEKVDKKEVNPALYYHKKSENPIEYARAFKDDGSIEEGVVQDAELFYPNLLDIPVSELLLVIGDSLSSLEVNELFSSFIEGLDGNDLLFKLLEGMQVGSLGNLDYDELLSKITISDLGLLEALGGFGSLSCFTKWDAVTDKFELDNQGGNLRIKLDQEMNLTENAKLYYFLVKGTHGQSDAVYARAFDDDGYLITNYYEDANGKIYTEQQPDTSLIKTIEDYDSETLYYVNLSDVSFSSIADVMNDSIGRIKVKEMFSAFGVSLDAGSPIEKVLGDRTFAELGDMQDKDVYLLDLLGQSADENLMNILLNVIEIKAGSTLTKPESKDQITLAHLANININLLPLSSVFDLPVAENGKTIEEHANYDLYNVILNAITVNKPADFSGITIGHLNYINTSNLPLHTVITLPVNAKGETDTTHENYQLYNILSSILKVGDLNDNGIIETNEIRDLNDNDMVDFNEITVGSLSKIDMNLLPLSTVFDVPVAENGKTIEEHANYDLYNILVSALSKDTDENDLIDEDEKLKFSDITVGSLSDYSSDNIPLCAIVPVVDGANGNGKMYDIIRNAIIVNEGETAITTNEQILVKHLKSMNMENALLSDFILPNETLKTVLCQALNCDFDEIKVSDLASEKFNFDNVSLSVFMKPKEGSYGNNILDALMQQEDVTVGNIGEKLNNLYLSDVYPANCFTTTDNGQAGYYLIENTDGIQIYVHEDKASGHELTDSTNKYYVSKEAHIWLFLHYGNVWDEGGLNGHDTYGNAYVYVDSHHTLADLQNDVDHMSEKVMEATIRQLVDAGMVNDYGSFKNESIYGMTLIEIIFEVGAR